MSHTYQLQIVNYLVTHWDKFFRYENRGTRPMNVTVEVTYGVTVSEEIENTFENKISVESSVKKSYIEVAQTDLLKMAQKHGTEAAQEGILNSAPGGASDETLGGAQARYLPGALEKLINTNEAVKGNGPAGIINRTKEQFREYQHTHKHS